MTHKWEHAQNKTEKTKNIKCSMQGKLVQHSLLCADLQRCVLALTFLTYEAASSSVYTSALIAPLLLLPLTTGFIGGETSSSRESVDFCCNTICWTSSCWWKEHQQCHGGSFSWQLLYFTQTDTAPLLRRDGTCQAGKRVLNRSRSPPRL